MGLVLINEPGTKTRTAPSINQQDTTPDLTWADPHTARNIEWRVFEDAWGSDHHPIETCIVGRAKRHKKHRTAKTTVWDDFRTILEGSTGTKLDDLTKLIRDAAKAATVETLIEKEAPIPDTRLLSLWRKRTNHLRRYRRTRKRRDIRKANRYAKEAQRHASRLCRDDWIKSCEEFNERTSLRRMWAVCNAMLGKSKGGNTAPNMALAQGKEITQILDEIGDVFFPQPATSPDPKIYEPEESKAEEYEADFTMWEMEAAIDRGNERSAAGPDGITNSMLKNLPEVVKHNLLKSINNAWHEGNIPEKWKLSWVCPIPKPGKKPDCASNVRPISLTSVLSKLMERMVLARIDWIIEHKREVLHPAQTGFRKNLGTQDSLVLIREYLVNRPTHCHPQLLVAVDIKKAFDTLPHATVIDTARKLGVRGRPLNFIKAFLSGRKYLVKTGKHCSSEQKTNEIGVPQGAVLSPVLFNLAMAPLLWRLAVIPDLAFTVYADDITAWTMGSDNAPPPETTIQRALDVVSDFLKEVGLHPSPEKTRYLAFGKGWEKIDADLRFDGQKIDKVAEHSILGVNVHSGGNPSAWIERMRSTWKKGLSIVRRLATRAGGLGERLAKTVVQAALISKISYGLRFYKFNTAQRAKLETLINDARRCISGLPKCTRLDLLHEAVPMLSLEEIERNQERTYGAKLAHTRQGRALSELMPPWSSLCAQTAQSLIPDPIPPWQKTMVTPACPIPRRMNSTTNAGRRRKFARRHEEKGGDGDDELRVYVDAAFKDGVATTAAWHYEHVTKRKELQHCGSAQEAEVNAVLEAIKDTAVSSSDVFHKLRVFTDSQATVRALRTQVKAHAAVGEIFRLAHELERRDPNPLSISVEWIPGHAGIDGNEKAHRAAIEELNRIDLRRQDPVAAPSVLPPSSAFNLYDPEGTVLNIKLAMKKEVKMKLNAKGELPEASIPLGFFRRHQTVKLRRLRAHAAITPARTQRWERAARERKKRVDGASIAIDHDYSLLSRKLRREEEACSKGCIYCTNRDVECDEHHLVWECPNFHEERTKALDALDQQLRPTSFEAWCRPEGERDKRVAVLSGLLSYLSETGLDMHI
ncbi:uncharacterized protein LOC121833283 [Ixodes scapularis]|uniref:uncharacterized protein LOC121833283 n=1 Tax=Ixodes scapularis TaxID=6945 RepID=UPI001C3920E1|nr:uncharacterized protein LOC121833283 [Ixodes scapularis]